MDTSALGVRAAVNRRNALAARQEGEVQLPGEGRHSGPQKREPGKSGTAR